MTEPDNFEQAMRELEGLVTAMEAGQLPLDEALAAYRRGALLVRFCQTRLDDAQQQVRILEGDVLKPYAGTESAGDAADPGLNAPNPKNPNLKNQDMKNPDPKNHGLKNHGPGGGGDDLDG